MGIGFGLQDVVRNFVAGLILMFERPLQRGDTIEVAGMLGQVREIGLRATIITTFEDAGVVVPNGMLLADKMINWTFNVRAWTRDFGDWVEARTELAMKIRNGLAEAGIEVPRTQRDVVIHRLPPQAAAAPSPAAKPA